MTDINFPDQLRSYTDNGVLRVHSKHYINDILGPIGEHLYLRSLPTREKKPNFAELFGADAWS